LNYDTVFTLFASFFKSLFIQTFSQNPPAPSSAQPSIMARFQCLSKF
jgi:hypothetical protein